VGEEIKWLGGHPTTLSLFSNDKLVQNNLSLFWNNISRKFAVDLFWKIFSWNSCVERGY